MELHERSVSVYVNESYPHWEGQNMQKKKRVYITFYRFASDPEGRRRSRARWFTATDSPLEFISRNALVFIGSDGRRWETTRPSVLCICVRPELNVGSRGHILRIWHRFPAEDCTSLLLKHIFSSLYEALFFSTFNTSSTLKMYEAMRQWGSSGARPISPSIGSFSHLRSPFRQCLSLHSCRFHPSLFFPPTLFPVTKLAASLSICWFFLQRPCTCSHLLSCWPPLLPTPLYPTTSHPTPPLSPCALLSLSLLHSLSLSVTLPGRSWRTQPLCHSIHLSASQLCLQRAAQASFLLQGALKTPYSSPPPPSCYPSLWLTQRSAMSRALW